MASSPAREIIVDGWAGASYLPGSAIQILSSYIARIFENRRAKSPLHEFLFLSAFFIFFIFRSTNDKGPSANEEYKGATPVDFKNKVKCSI